MPPCRHHDIQVFDGLRCCLACGEALFQEPSDQGVSTQHIDRPRHQYNRLEFELGQEIRLVMLYPGKPSDDIAFKLIHANLLDKPVYEALSYTWATEDGDASLSETLSCQGHEMLVTKNCAMALRSLRRKGRNRVLWVDAICIDQSSIAERNHQVNLMDIIYSNASQVLVYLGQRSEATDQVFDYLGSVADHHYHRQGPTRDFVVQFLSLRWFDRIWVLQEVALAKLVLLTAGDRTVHWTSQSTHRMMMLCRLAGIDPPSVLQWSPGWDKASDLLHVLHISRNCSSSDPRDKVFAVLSLANQQDQKLIAVDYSLSAEQVFAELAARMITKGNRLDILRLAHGQPLFNPTLPSWVPDWSLKGPSHPLRRPQFSTSQMEFISSNWLPLDQVPGLESDHPSHLQVLALAKENVHGDGVMTTASWHRWLSEHAGRNSSFVLALMHSKIYARYLTKTLNHDFHFTVASTKPPLSTQMGTNLKCLKSLKIRAHFLDRIVPEWTLVVKPPPAFGVHTGCTTCGKHRRHKTRPMEGDAEQEFEDECKDYVGDYDGSVSKFHTKHSLGITHRTDFQAGDGIWALDGVRVPFILRREGPHYLLIGECYFYRALTRFHPCAYCGNDTMEWPTSTEIIEIW